jgi:NitT/TauT family transport system substrate-binding protein
MVRRLGLATAMVVAAVTSADAGTLRLGLEPWLGYGPLWVAQDRGFFARHGVEVELTLITMDRDMRAALQNGDIEVAASPTNGLILEVNRGSAQKGFLVLDTSLQADAILARPEISRIADLVGKTIAYETGTTSDLLLGYALKTHGMSLADVKPVPTAASDAGLALASGKVQAAVTYEPYISAALARNRSDRVIYTAASRPGLISDMLTATTIWIEAHSDDVRALIRAWDDAVKFIRKHPSEGLATIAAAVGRPIDEIKTAFAGLRLYTVQENVEFLDGTFQATIADIGEIMRTIHPEEIKTIPSAEELLSLDDVYAVAR